MDTTSFFTCIPKQLSNHHHLDHHDHDHDQDHYFDHHHHSLTTTTMSGLSSDSAEPAHGGGGGGAGEKWAPRLLKECARAISEKDSSKIHHLLWMLNELSSPYGDSEQKLAASFLQALFCKATSSGRRCHQTLAAAAHKARTFEAARRVILKFQEVSPWTTFGHVASNGAILEALDGEANLHIVDVSNTLCTQWPTLLESLATRTDDTPRLRLTVVDPTGAAGGGAVMKEVGQRMEKFARLMGVPFEFNAVNVNGVTTVTRDGLGIRDGEAVAVNCVGAMRSCHEREAAVTAFRSLDPKVVTLVEEEADFAGPTPAPGDFVARFEECLRFYGLYLEMLEESFPRTSNEKLMLERECSRGIVRVLGFDEEEKDENDGDADGGGWDSEGRERGKRWSERMARKGFRSVGYSDDVVDDVKALLKRYPSGIWGLVLPKQQQQCDDHDNSSAGNNGIYLTWKDEPVVWASAWKP